MAKVVLLLVLATAYLVGVHALTNRALEEEQRVASFYTSPVDPPTALLASPQVGLSNH